MYSQLSVHTATILIIQDNTKNATKKVNGSVNTNDDGNDISKNRNANTNNTGNKALHQQDTETNTERNTEPKTEPKGRETSVDEVGTIDISYISIVHFNIVLTIHSIPRDYSLHTAHLLYVLGGALLHALKRYKLHSCIRNNTVYTRH
jgi:hypothetical protein